MQTLFCILYKFKGLSLIDDFDAEGPGWTDDALDNVLHRDVSQLKAVILWFDPCNLIYGPHRHHACDLMPWVEGKERGDEKPAGGVVGRDWEKWKRRWSEGER